ncbi:hypothetical protein Tco_0782452 [Tanacetum coccineum]
MDAGELSAQKRSIVIRLRLPPRRSTRLTPPTPTPVLTADEAHDLILQDTIQLKGTENVEGDSLIPRNDDDQNIPGTRLEPRSDKESPEELTVNDPTPSSSTPSSCSPNPKVSTTNNLLSLLKAKPGRFKCYKSFFHELQGRYGYLFEHLKTTFMPRRSFDSPAFHLQDVMSEALPKMVDDHIQEQAKRQVSEQVQRQVPIYVVEGLILERKQNKDKMAKMIAEAVQQERRNLQAEISSQIQNAITNHIPSQVNASARSYLSGHILHVHPTQAAPISASAQEQQYQMQKTSEYEAYVSVESLSRQINKSDQGPSSSGNQEQVDDFDFWINSYASDDDEVPTKQVSQDLMDEIMQTINEAKLYKIDDEMKQREPGKPKEEIYSNSKIVQVIKTYWELGHEHNFVTEIIARRANGNIVSITKSDYKNLNKNDIEDMYLLVVNDKVPDYAETELLWSLSVFVRSTVIREKVHDFQLGMESYQHKVNLTAPTITFLGIKKYQMFSIVSEPVYGIIYKNNKKEKRVMRHLEIHKFCDATFKRVLVGLKSYNNDVKYGYAKTKVTKEDVEYLQLFEEEIEERLKHRDRMRRWEMYVNGRPLGSRRERTE